MVVLNIRMRVLRMNKPRIIGKLESLYEQVATALTALHKFASDNDLAVRFDVENNVTSDFGNDYIRLGTSYTGDEWRGEELPEFVSGWNTSSRYCP